MPTVSTKWDIKSLFEHYAGIQVVGSSIVHGVQEYHSNCPWCPGSTDSLILRPDTGQFTHAVRSNGCGRSGDAIDFLMDYVNMTRQEAVEELALEGVQFSDEKNAVRHVNSNDVAPSKKWMETAELIVARAERYLWHPGSAEGRKALAYLHGRGLRDETIKKARLGYVPLMPDGKWYIASFEEWGIDPEALTESQRAKDGVRVPNGILIPWFVGGQVWKLEMVRPGEERMPKGQVIGSVECLYNVDSLQYGDIAMMLESAIDSLSVSQEAEDLVTPVATGSSSKGRAMRWLTELMMASFILQGFDEDPGGDTGAEYWLSMLPRCSRWSPILWNDVNELLQAQLQDKTEGFTLRNWVQLGVDMVQRLLALEAQADTPAREALLEAEEHFDPAEEQMPVSTQSIQNNIQPDPLEEDLSTFACKIAEIVDIFGGADKVKMVKHNGETIEQVYPATYKPETLPVLPRKRCPHGLITNKRVSDEMSNATPGHACKGEVLAHGWCALHADCDALLQLGARLGYPEMPLAEIPQQMADGRYRRLPVRVILAGVENWEAYTEVVSAEHVQQDVKFIKARYKL